MAPPNPPAITINAPNTQKPVPPPSTSTPEEKSCYLCDEQNPGDFAPTTKFLDGCLLCTRDFCPIHKGAWEHVCNINHSTYYHAHQDVPDVYPSLGEREKALFMSPVTLNDATKRAIEAFRDSNADPATPKDKLVEEVDFVGADIAA